MKMRASIGEFWRRVSRRGADECWLWQGAVGTHGYGTFGSLGLAHRISWVESFGEIPEGLWVLHRCDVPLCVNPAHLFLGTSADNVRDMNAKGRGVSGLALKTAADPDWRKRVFREKGKITAEQAMEIRATYQRGARGRGYRELGRRFGISASVVRRIVAGKAWVFA